MKKKTDKTKKIIYCIIFGCVTLILIAAFVTGLVGLLKEIDFLIHLSLIFFGSGSIVNGINICIFKLNDKKSRSDTNDFDDKSDNIS